MTTDSIERTLRHMRDTYGSFMQNVKLLDLDPSKVPTDLEAYIPYAALWGIADDLEREKLVSQAPEEAKSDLLRTAQLIDDLLDDWLAGSESASSSPSAEYIAFSAMRMAADFI